MVAWTGAKAAIDYKTGEPDYTIERSWPVAGECIELKVLLPQTTTELLRQRGALRGISGSTLAAELLVTIAHDGLYDAVLDGR
jgi:hypothetical protein